MRGRGRAAPALCLALAALCWLLAGCGGLDYMIEEYNSRFGIHSDGELRPGDEGYDGKDMIEDLYEVAYGQENHTLNIPAPAADGATYRWQVFTDATAQQEVSLDEKVAAAQTLMWDIPGTLAGKNLRLRLTVRAGGREYVDEAAVHVKVREGGPAAG